MNKRWIIISFCALALLLLALFMPGRAIYADNTMSSCTNDTVNALANDCYTLTPPTTTGTITIDGMGIDADWGGAITKDLTGDYTGTVSVLRDAGNLYLLITLDDNSFNASDRVRIFFDPLHNHSATGDDTEFRIVRDTSPNPNHRKVIGGADSAWDPSLLGSEVATATAAASWTIETRLAAAEFDVSDLPTIMGFGVQGDDLNTGNLSVWPTNFSETDPANSWANLKTRYPVDYMIVLDYSGSMLNQNKWDDAVQAANYMVNAMSILGEPTYFTDHVGVITFSWLCSGVVDQTVTIVALSAVPAFPAGAYINGLEIPPPASNNCTPIGEGLAEAFNASNLNATVGEATEERQRAVLLLSDGLQNRPANTFNPGDTGYDPCGGTPNWDPCPITFSNVNVNTVAFGEGDWNVDTDLLSDITNRYAGDFASDYTLTPDVEGLKEAFISALDNSYRMNMVYSGPFGATFMVNAGERKLVTILSWPPATASTAENVILQRMDGGTWVDENCDQSGFDMTVGFAICAVNDPQAGQWRSQAADGMFSPNPASEFVLVDLNLSARFAIDQAIHGTGIDIILTAELVEGGQPLTNDPAVHPVSVTVNIERPEEGFGTFVATHTPECEETEPTLPALDPRGGIFLPQLGQSLTVGPQPPSAVVTGNNPDPAANHFSLMAQLLQACDKNDLQRTEEPGLELRDDGTQGDAVANDGIYTLQFMNTDFEGSYLFRFNAQGTTLAGSQFARTKVLGEYVRVEVDPASSPVGSRTLQQNGSLIFQEYHILPRDQFGGYLGPGHADEIQILSTGGQWLGPVLDYENGYYARILQYDTSQGDKPEVTIIVQGKPIGEDGLFGLPDWLWILILVLLLLIILVLLLLLLICWRRKKRLKAGA